MIATLTSKGQLAVPKPIRDRLHLKAGDKVEFVLDEDGRLEVIPVTASVTQLKRMVPLPTKKVSLEDMDDAIQKNATR